jgi:hypothetical protein
VTSSAERTRHLDDLIRAWRGQPRRRSRQAAAASTGPEESEADGVRDP